MSTGRLHSVTVGQPGAAVLTGRLHAVSVTGSTPLNTGQARLHQVSLSGSSPAGATTGRLHQVAVAGGTPASDVQGQLYQVFLTATTSGTAPPTPTLAAGLLILEAGDQTTLTAVSAGAASFSASIVENNTGGTPRLVQVGTTGAWTVFGVCQLQGGSFKVGVTAKSSGGAASTAAQITFTTLKATLAYEVGGVLKPAYRRVKTA